MSQGKDPGCTFLFSSKVRIQIHADYPIYIGVINNIANRLCGEEQKISE